MQAAVFVLGREFCSNPRLWREVAARHARALRQLYESESDLLPRVRLSGFRLTNPQPSYISPLETKELHALPTSSIEMLEPGALNMQPGLANYLSQYTAMLQHPRAKVNLIGQLLVSTTLGQTARGASSFTFKLKDRSGRWASSGLVSRVGRRYLECSARLAMPPFARDPFAGTGVAR